MSQGTYTVNLTVSPRQTVRHGDVFISVVQRWNISGAARLKRAGRSVSLGLGQSGEEPVQERGQGVEFVV